MCTGSALTTAVAARVPSAAAISPLAGPPELEDAVDAQREKVRLVGCLWLLYELVFIFSASYFVAHTSNALSHRHKLASLGQLQT